MEISKAKMLWFTPSFSRLFNRVLGFELNWWTPWIYILSLTASKERWNCSNVHPFVEWWWSIAKVIVQDTFFLGESPVAPLRIATNLVRLLNDHAKRLFEDVNPPDIKPALLFEEILRSYRLIFGQDERSWKAFSKILTKLEEDQGQGRSISACDPLLRVLCGQSCASPEARAIYEEIDVRRGAIPDGQPMHCNLYTEFPFFGPRLLELQQFDRRCQPQTVRSTQEDKRDVAPWFTLRNKRVSLAKVYLRALWLITF